MSSPNRRRQLIVDPKLQRRIVLAAGWPPCLAMAGSILLLGFFCSRLSREALEAGVELPSLLWVFLATAAFIVVATGFVLWTALRISHRVAGPTFNVRRVLARVRSGDLTARVHLRSDDYLGGVAETINEHLDWLQQHPPEGSEAGEGEGSDATEGSSDAETVVAAGAPTSNGA
jgi:hypothetical protein